MQKNSWKEVLRSFENQFSSSRSLIFTYFRAMTVFFVLSCSVILKINFHRRVPLGPYLPGMSKAWIKFDSSGKYYLFDRTQLSWNDAKAFCESKGGHLAEIMSERETWIFAPLPSFSTERTGTGSELRTKIWKAFGFGITPRRTWISMLGDLGLMANWASNNQITTMKMRIVWYSDQIQPIGGPMVCVNRRLRLFANFKWSIREKVCENIQSCTICDYHALQTKDCIWSLVNQLVRKDFLSFMSYFNCMSAQNLVHECTYCTELRLKLKSLPF